MMDPYASHIGLTVNLALQSKGPIVETGCGFYSSEVLQNIAQFLDVPYYRILQDAQWPIDNGIPQPNPDRTIITDNYPEFIMPFHAGFILVDHEEPVAERMKFVKNNIVHTDILIMHDAMATELWRDMKDYIFSPRHNSVVWKKI